MEEGVSPWTKHKARNWETHPFWGGGGGHLSAMFEGKRRQSQYGRGRMARRIKTLLTLP